jgi:hypothetical protein
MIKWMRHIIYWAIISSMCLRSRINILMQDLLFGLLECLFFLACIKMLLWCCILSDPMVLVLIQICFICSYFGSTSSIYIDVFTIISSFCGNPLNILIILIPFSLYICQKCRTIFSSMICCATIHTCRWW